MKFSLSWLKRHLETTASAANIAEKLTTLGLEVESLDDPAARLAGFVVGHILEADKHPNADRLKLCRVTTGATTLQVVCGAPNARAGLKVVLATPGVIIPETGLPLKVGTVRGVESKGMMCSSRELLLGDDHDGIIELPADAPVGRPLVEVLDLDPVFDIAVTPNRADCLGVRGIARDLAAAGVGTLKPMSADPVKSAGAKPVTLDVALPVEHADACPRFLARTIRGVRNGESPLWLKQRLSAAGQRPVSALVDITNYFTLDLNRPLHVFDAATIEGGLTVRFAAAGESLTALNGKTYALDESMTVVADDQRVLALAGVMGGESSGVTLETRAVVLEVALFDPIRTVATGRRLGIESDARYRFERGVDPGFVDDAIEMATRMIIELCGGEASDTLGFGQPPAPRTAIAFRPERVARLGGVTVPAEAMADILLALGCRLERAEAAWAVTPPSWRADLVAEHDLVEEVLRVHGYDAIPETTLPRPAVTRPVLTVEQRRAGWLRRTLAGRGLAEAVTFSFLSSAHAALFGGGDPALRLANPMSADLDILRPGLLPNLIAAAGRNIDRGAHALGLFEVGPQFDSATAQTLMAAGLRAGLGAPRHWSAAPRAVDPFDVKADVMAAIAAAGGPVDSLQTAQEAPMWYHPGRSGSLKLGAKTIAWFGEVHPRVTAAFDIKLPMVAFEVFLDALPLPKARSSKARPPFRPSALQPIERDFAFLVDRDVAAESLVRAARAADKTLIVDVALFDCYVGPHVPDGKKSLAIQVTLQPSDRTLTDAEIDSISATIVGAVGRATGGVLRG